jgi:hypothetical protein
VSEPVSVTEGGLFPCDIDTSSVGLLVSSTVFVAFHVSVGTTEFAWCLNHDTLRRLGISFGLTSKLHDRNKALFLMSLN